MKYNIYTKDSYSSDAPRVKLGTAKTKQMAVRITSDLKEKHGGVIFFYEPARDYFRFKLTAMICLAQLGLICILYLSKVGI